MKLSFTLVVAGSIFLLGGVNLSAHADSETNSVSSTNSGPSKPKWRTITVKPRPDLPKIHFYNKINPIWWFKNLDNPVPPDWYRPNDKHRKFKWSFRNPLHNFHFYVAGVADKKFYRSGKFPEENANPHGGWDFEAARYKLIWLPFISYHREKFDFYFGWRNHGNFGIKVNVNPGSKPEVNTSKK